MRVRIQSLQLTGSTDEPGFVPCWRRSLRRALGVVPLRTGVLLAARRPVLVRQASFLEVIARPVPHFRCRLATQGPYRRRAS